MFTELSNKIWSHQQFHEEYSSALVGALRQEWRLRSGSPTEGIDSNSISRLLQVATHFAGSDEVQHHRAAYRIALASWILTGGTQSSVIGVIRVILGRLGNLPALDFLFEQSSNTWNAVRTPLPLALESAAREKQNTVTLAGTDTLRLTDFQKTLWESLSHRSAVIVTAPTSAGKSFALQNYLVNTIFGSKASVCVYLVPSRALISQVSDSFRKLLEERDMTDVITATIPQTPQELGTRRAIYVLTQERLQMLLDKAPDLKSDFTVVDEAQMVAESARGIILQTAVERLRRINPKAPLLFGSPTASNPEVFSRLFQISDAAIVKTDESPVAQQLVQIDLDGNEPTNGTVRLMLNGTLHEVGNIQFNSVLAKAEHILGHVALRLGQGQQNLIYVGSADRCETVCRVILDLNRQNVRHSEVSESHARERSEFAAFLREHFHQQYELAEAIEDGIAFHYGGMPSTIRQALESMFTSGAVHTLVCTATLLHGVNFPARNVFLFDPTKDGVAWSANSKGLSSAEFWNLAGRAGRLKKEFSGNIFIIAPERWRVRSFEGNPRQQVQPALAEQLTAHLAKLREFVSNDDIPSGKDDALENAFMRLLNDCRRGRLGETLSFLSQEQAKAVQTDVIPLIERIASALTVPTEIAESNANVSVLRQEEMLSEIRSMIQTSGTRSVCPVHPMQPSAYIPLATIIERVHRIFMKMNNNSFTYMAVIALQWMQGASYKEFIDYQWQRRLSAAQKKRDEGQKRVRDPELGSVIRSVFVEIENKLRFTYVKFLKCYMDLLRHALVEFGETDLSERLVPIALYLELGASSITMVNLIGLGVSRVSAALLADIAPSTNMTRLEIVRWLRATDLANRGVSPIVLRELIYIVPKK